MAVKGTEFTVRDAAGNALCHSAGQRKRDCDSRRKRAVREGFALMMQAAGMLNGTQARCSLTGAWFDLATVDTPNNELIVVDRGHVVSDEHDGAFCPCNLVGELRAHNKAHGRSDLDSSKFVADPRTAWRMVWEQHYATPRKRSLAV